MKKIISILICASLILTGFTSFAQQTTGQTVAHKMTFTDVNETTEEGKSIYKLVDVGVINGNGDGTFTPQNGITRAEFCKMINLVYNYTEKDQVLFTDVKASDWYYEQVLIAKKAGYIKGYEDGTFRGDNNITRQEFCTIITRINNLTVKGTAPTIADEVESWALEYVNAVLTNGVTYTADNSSKNLMSLEAGNTFRATVPIKRGEVAVVLAPCYDVVNKTASFAQATIPVTPSTGGGGGGGGDGGSDNRPQLPSYVISFNTDGGSTIASKTVYHGSKVTKPANPTKSGFTFVNWYTDSAKTTVYDFSKTVSGGFTLYAKWEQNTNTDTTTTYTVTFNSNGGSSVDSKSVLKDDYASEPDEPVRDGYNFAGWYSDSACTAPFDFGTPITKDTTVYAKWSQIKMYTVTFAWGTAELAQTILATDNVAKPSPKRVTEGECVEEPETPYLEYYQFVGWYTEYYYFMGTEYDFSEPVTENITLYGIYEPVADEMKSANAEIVESLDIAKGKLVDFMDDSNYYEGDDQYDFVALVVKVLEDVILKDELFIINKVSIYAEHGTGYILDAKNIFDGMEKRTKDEFLFEIQSLDEDTYNFLLDFFEIDPDKYLQ